MPKQWSDKDFTTMTDLIGQCVETVLKSDELRLNPSVEGVEAAYRRCGMVERLTEAFDPVRESTITSLAQLSGDWDSLLLGHKCSICQDVLAAPVIINCTHNFCGLCLESYTRCAPSDQGKVTHFCPECRVEIETRGIYERTLDDAIAKKVEKISYCEQSTDWKNRRNEYFKLLKARGRPLPTGSDDDDRRITETEDFIQWVVFFIAAVTVGVLVNRHLSHRSASSV
jgi:hypothetical protein